MAHLSLTAESLLDHLAGADVDVLRTVCQHALQRLVELEATTVVGAAPYEHSAERTTYRNGHRPKTLDTRVGRLELQIPKLRSGSFFPWLLVQDGQIAEVAYQEPFALLFDTPEFEQRRVERETRLELATPTLAR